MTSMPFDRLPDSAEAERDLRRRLNRLLDQQGYGPHRTLALSVERDVVVVQGRVPTFYQRQVAVECLKRVAGVTQVIDRIEVVYLPDDCPVNDCSADEPKASTISTEHRVDLPDMARAAQDPPRSHFRRRQAFLTQEALSEIARVTIANLLTLETREPFLEGTTL